VEVVVVGNRASSVQPTRQEIFTENTTQNQYQKKPLLRFQTRAFSDEARWKDECRSDTHHSLPNSCSYKVLGRIGVLPACHLIMLGRRLQGQGWRGGVP
jgi:hypothetical protein